jgi:hypothetical protein
MCYLVDFGALLLVAGGALAAVVHDVRATRSISVQQAFEMAGVDYQAAREGRFVTTR